MNCSKNTVQKIIAIATLMILMSVSLFTYRQYDEYKRSEQEYINIEKAMTTEMNILINAILLENVKKAELYIGDRSNEIHTRLLKEYGNDLINLEEDIQNPSQDSKLTKILDDVLSGIYINENNSSNKPFVGSMSSILWSKHMGFNINIDETITWEKLINSHFNIYLAQEAIDTIKKMNLNKRDLIFWEPVKVANTEHEIIKDMTVDELVRVFNNEGLESLKSYELLVPTYITKEGDVFGTSDIDSLGHRVENYKIIIIQRINVYDALKPYQGDIAYCESEIDKMTSSIIETNKRIISLVIQALIFTIFILIGSAYLQNKYIKNK